MPDLPQALGGVFLGGVQFSTDPKPYEPSNWKKRVSVHQIIGGTVVIQDFGLWLPDRTLKLGSGNERPMMSDVKDAIQGFYASQGATFAFADWLGNSFNVFILNFRSEPFLRGSLSVDLYFYDLDLQVVG